MSVAAAVLSLHEEGVARLVFDKTYSSFEGVLINGNEEVFALRGIPIHFAKGGPEPVSSENEPSVVPKDARTLLPVCDLYVVDEETGTNYVLKKVKVSECHNEDEPDYLSISLKSDTVSFQSTDVLVGNRADKEFRQYMNPAMIGKNLRIYMGPMKINFTTAITPPSTPIPIPIGTGKEQHLGRPSLTRGFTRDYDFEPGTPREGDFFQ